MEALAAVRVSSAARPISGRTAAYGPVGRHQPGHDLDRAEDQRHDHHEAALGALRRRAATSAPASEPTAMKVPRSPYCLGPEPELLLGHQRRLVSWKFIPKVPTKNTTQSTSRISRADRT